MRHANSTQDRSTCYILLKDVLPYVSNLHPVLGGGGGGVKAKTIKSVVPHQIFHLKSSISETKGRRG